MPKGRGREQYAIGLKYLSAVKGVVREGMYQTVPCPSTYHVSWSVIDIPDDTAMSDTTEEIAILSDKTGRVVRNRFM